MEIKMEQMKTEMMKIILEQKEIISDLQKKTTEEYSQN